MTLDEAIKHCVDKSCGNSQCNEEHKQLSEWLKELKQYEDANKPRPIEEWGEDYGDCLWWSFPIVEPPYCGTPLDSVFPDYVTHFTRLVLPID